MNSSFEKTYPHIDQWVYEQGWIEIGQDENSRSFLRALDEGGLVWEGKEHYETMEDALSDLNKALGKWLNG